MKTQTKNTAPDWLSEGRCLITGGISSLYLKNRDTTKKTRKTTNWGKHETV